MNFATLDEENLIKIDTKIENKIDFSILKNIKEVSIETGIDWQHISMCNLSFKYNVHELSNGEKGLYLFRIEDLTDFYNKSVLCCSSYKNFKAQIDSPDIKNNAIDYKPSLIIKKKEKNSCNCFSFESIFEIFQNFGNEDKLFCVISYIKKCDSFNFYLGERENSMKYKVVGEFSNVKNSCYKLFNFENFKPKPVNFDIILPLAIEIKVGSLTKYYRSSFEDLNVEKLIVDFPPEASAEEKVMFICLGAIINLVLFGEND